MKKILSLVLAIAAIVPAFAQNSKNGIADSIVGEYLVPDTKNGDSKVCFTKNAAGTYDCQVFWLANPTDPATGKPWLDFRNPDKSLRNVRCDQLFIIRGLQHNSKDKVWDGTKVYDPNRGVSARVKCKFNASGELEVRGTVLGIGETQCWKKLEPSVFRNP